MFGFGRKKTELVTADQALPGRDHAIMMPGRHRVSGRPMAGPYPDGTRIVDLGLGCFWGAERLFWQLPGVFVTAVGYAGGTTPNPTYEEVCSGLTGHTEAVRVVFDPVEMPLDELLKHFWEAHDPTQGMRQGNDVGTQYRSAIYTHGDQDLAAVRASAAIYQAGLTSAGHGLITTDIRPAGPFYFAEAYHQQYLDANPNGYCGLRGTGVACPIPQPA